MCVLCLAGMELISFIAAHTVSRFGFVRVFQVLISPLAPTPTPFPEAAHHGAASPAHPTWVRASLLSISQEVEEHINSFVAPFCKQWGGMCGHMECCAVLTDWCESCSQEPIPLTRKKAKQRNTANVHPAFSRWQKLKGSDTTSNNALCKHKESYVSTRSHCL